MLMSKTKLSGMIVSQWRLFRSFWKLLFVGFTLTVLSNIVSMVFAVINQRVIDSVFVALDFNFLLRAIPYIGLGVRQD